MNLIPYGRQNISNEDIALVKKVLKSKIITNGKEILNFENKFKNYVKSKYSLACNSGTSGLFLAMSALNLKKDDVIVMPAINFIASYNVAKFFSAKIYLADIDPNTGQMSPETFEACCKKFSLKKVKIILLMYLGGFPVNADKFQKLKKKYNAKILEDACHALGSFYNNNKKRYMIGSCKHSDICVFSLHPVKTITTGEGGVITTNSKDMYKAIYHTRSLGITRSKKHWDYDVKKIGLNFRLNEFQSILGTNQLKRINKFLDYREKIYNFYKTNLKNVSQISILSKSNSNYTSSNHLFIIRIKNSNKKKKERFIKYMLKKKISLQFHYIPIFKFKIFNDKFLGKNSIAYYEEAISLPIYYKLSSRDLVHIVKTIKSFFNAR